MPEMVLSGCQSRPLAGYLKALGILALVSRQKDTDATGYWSSAGFVLTSTLDKQGLQDFFLHDYVPTPLVTPWNKGSGFYKDVSALACIRATETPRFALYRQIIESIFAWEPFIDTSDTGKKRVDRLKNWCEKNKQAILQCCRNTLPECCVDWLDAVFILHEGKNASCPPLLGSGGNDGNLEFVLTFMNCLVDLFITPKTVPLASNRLQAALWGLAVPDIGTVALGQFDPGNAGGYNQGMGIEHKDVPANPWDFVLMLEGAVLFAGAVSRKGAADPMQATAPFVVQKAAAGYASASLNDEGHGEMWLPLWGNASSLREIRHVLREGRATLGRRQAHTGVDFARAVGSLGVDRGIKSFERFSFIKRRGKSYVALPTGRISVRYSPDIAILEEAEKALREVRKADKAPAGLLRVARVLEQALFHCALQPEPTHFQAVCRALARIDALPALKKYLHRPLGPLRADWIRLCDDNSPEVRLAAALASLHSDTLGPLRCNLTPVAPKKPWTWADADTAVCWQGSDVYAKLGAVLMRRLVDGARTGTPETALQGRLQLHSADVLPLLTRQIDANKLEELTRAFSLVDFRQVKLHWPRPVRPLPLPHGWVLLKLLHIPLKSPTKDTDLRPEPRIAHLLRAGRMEEACAIAERRLQIHGFALKRLPHYAEALRGMDASATLASLLVPVYNDKYLLKIITKTTENA